MAKDTNFEADSLVVTVGSAEVPFQIEFEDDSLVSGLDQSILKASLREAILKAGFIDDRFNELSEQ